MSDFSPITENGLCDSCATSVPRTVRIPGAADLCETCLREGLAALDAAGRQARIVAASARYTCECVKLNEELGIRTMVHQEVAGRSTLMLGLVSETLSALKSCPSCAGSGIPATAPEVRLAPRRPSPAAEDEADRRIVDPPPAQTTDLDEALKRSMEKP